MGAEPNLAAERFHCESLASLRPDSISQRESVATASLPTDSLEGETRWAETDVGLTQKAYSEQRVCKQTLRREIALTIELLHLKALIGSKGSMYIGFANSKESDCSQCEKL